MIKKAKKTRHDYRSGRREREKEREREREREKGGEREREREREGEREGFLSCRLTLFCFIMLQRFNQERKTGSVLLP